MSFFVNAWICAFDLFFFSRAAQNPGWLFYLETQRAASPPLRLPRVRSSYSHMVIGYMSPVCILTWTQAEHTMEADSMLQHSGHRRPMAVAV